VEKFAVRAEKKVVEMSVSDTQKITDNCIASRALDVVVNHFL